MKKLVFQLLILILFSSCFEPTDTDYSNKILFTSKNSGINQIYIMNPDGTDIEQITKGEFEHSRGRWSSDAKSIACKTTENSSSNGQPICIIDLCNSKETFLSFASSFEWYPDNQKIIYSFMPVANFGYSTSNIYTEIVKDTLISNPLESNIYCGTPSYSPDGQFIAYCSNEGFVDVHPTSTELYIMDNDGSNQHRLTFLDTTWSSAPVWANNDLIYFNSAGRICSINLFDSSVTILHQDENYASVSPRLSPSNDEIIFIKRPYSGGDRNYIYKMNVDGSNVRRILQDSTVSSCDWSK